MAGAAVALTVTPDRIAVGKGDVWLSPAEAGECAFQPSEEVALLEIVIP
jgi:hypothetical protein